VAASIGGQPTARLDRLRRDDTLPAMRALICLFIVASGVAAADPLPTPVAIESVTAPSDAKGDDPLWKLVTSSGSPWCQAKAGVGLGEPLTITLAAPAEIARVEITTMNDGNTVASAEVTADGKVAKAPTVDVTLGAGSTGHSLTVVKLPGAAVRTLVVKLVTSKQTARDVTCARSVELEARGRGDLRRLRGRGRGAVARPQAGERCLRIV
jgi:hypothetical protein